MGKIYVVFMMERIAKSYEAKKTQTQAKLKSDHPQKSVSSSQKIRKIIIHTPKTVGFSSRLLTSPLLSRSKTRFRVKKCSWRLYEIFVKPEAQTTKYTQEI